jgi:hypothetical protein
MQSFSPGSTVFDNALSQITPTNGEVTGLTVTSILDDNGFGYGEITLTNPVPASIEAEDKIVITSATDINNNGVYEVRSVAGNVIEITGPFTSSEGGTALVASNKFQVGAILQFTGTALNDTFKFTITNVTGTVLTVYPAPTTETVAPTNLDQFLPNGSALSFGVMALNDGEPHDFTVSPTDIETFYQIQIGSLYSNNPISAKWILGEQYSNEQFFISIRENPSYGEDVIRIDNLMTPFVPNRGNGTLLIDSTVSAIDVNLPPIDEFMDGWKLTIKCRAYTNAITINSDAADDIDGVASLSITTQYQSWTLEASYDSGGNSYWNIA